MGCTDEKETEMMRVRWRVFSFFFQIPKHEQWYVFKLSTLLDIVLIYMDNFLAPQVAKLISAGQDDKKKE